jgi:hypothetical protein
MNSPDVFYRTQGIYTQLQTDSQLLLDLPDDDESVSRFIKYLLIHPIDAREAGVRFDARKVMRSHADYRSVDDILTNPKVSSLLARDTAELKSTPAQRAILSCDHHALLFTAIRRMQGHAVRMRCGYATNLMPGALTPHWVCEVYDDQKERWAVIDPERSGRPIESGAFLPAGRVWFEAKSGGAVLGRVLPDYRSGLDGVKYRLLCDVNALMKHELLHYDWIIREAPPQAPALFLKPPTKLTGAEIALLDDLAVATLDVDNQWATLQTLYGRYVSPRNLRHSPNPN